MLLLAPCRDTLARGGVQSQAIRANERLQNAKRKAEEARSLGGWCCSAKLVLIRLRSMLRNPAQRLFRSAWHCRSNRSGSLSQEAETRHIGNHPAAF